MERFEADVRARGRTAVIEMRGQLDGEAEAAMSAARSDADALDPEAILLKFDQVSYINSTGIALIVALLASARQSSTKVLATGLSDHYKQIFQITRLSDFMTMYTTEQEALDAAGNG